MTVALDEPRAFDLSCILASLPCAPNTFIPEYFEDRHLAERPLPREVEHGFAPKAQAEMTRKPGVELGARRTPPVASEDTARILSEMPDHAADRMAETQARGIL